MSEPTGEDVWIEVSDALLAGITHDLNGRVAAISGLLQVLAPTPSDDEALALLRQEGERLDATVALLRGYPRGAEREPEAIDPRELLPALLALHARRDDQDGASARLEILPGAPPAQARRTWLARGLLVLFARAGRNAPGGAASFCARAAGFGDRAHWTVRPERGAGTPGGTSGSTAEGSHDPFVSTARTFVERAGGELRVAEGGWELVLPAVAG